jgi:hypothetical protein
MKTRSQPKALEVSPDSRAAFAARLEQIRAEAEAFIEEKVRALKATPDSQLLPIDWLRADLRKRHGGSCNCRCALSLLEDEKQ